MQVMVGNNYGSYAFNATTGVITLSGVTLLPGQLKMIVNAKTNVIIFNLADPAQTATISGNTITLAYNTSGMGNSDPLQIFLDVPADLVPQAVVGTFWQSTQPVSGTVAISNLPSTQPVSGSVSVSNFPTTQPVSWSGQSVAISGTVPVSGTFWQATQPVSGTVTANISGSISNTVFGVSGDVAIVNSTTSGKTSIAVTADPVTFASPQHVIVDSATLGTVAVSGTFWQATQPISGSVAVSNFPSSQHVTVDNPTTSVSVSNFPGTQTISGSISVSNFPSTQAVTGTFWQGTQPVSGTVAVSGSVAVTNAGTFAVQAGVPALGQALAAASLPVVLTAAQLTTLTPPAAITGFALETGGNLATIATNTGNIPTLGQALAAASVPVVLTAAQLTTLTPPAVFNGVVTNAGTFATQATLAAETTKVIGTVNVSAGQSIGVTGTFWQATQPVSGTVTGLLQDGSGNAISSTSGSLNVNVTGGASNTQYVDGSTPGTAPTGTVMLGQYGTAVQALQTDANGYLQVSSIDGKVLDTQSSITSTGPGATYTVGGFGYLAYQFGGIWAGAIRVEASNDGVNWIQQYVQYLGSGYISDIINLPTIVQVTASSTYMRYNVVSLQSGTITATVIGNTGVIPTTNLLGMSFDSASGVQQNVNLSNVKLDTTNALVLSDAPAPVLISGGVGQVIIVDTQGYQSLNITTEALTANVLCSNDKVTWSALTGAPLVFGALVTAVAANTGYTFPCLARFIRFTVTAVGTATVFLRNQPWQGAYTTTVPTGTAQNNMLQIGSTNVVSAGVAGTLAVGGNIAVGVAQTNNPLVVGGIDTTNLTRRLQTDAAGRLITSSIDQSNTTRNLGSISPANSMQNVAALAVQDLTQFEGQSIAELLAQILIELRISNYYNYNLPTLLTTGLTNSTGDEPAALRNDPGISTVFG